MYSIVIPYLKNSKYIEVCKHYLQKNSSLEYELVEIVDESDVYYAYNSGVYKAKYDKVILINADMIVSKDWDVNFVRYISRDTVITGHVVEHSPGVVLELGTDRPITNIKYDCGKTLQEFDYNKFQSFVDSQSVPDLVHGKKGWYMPIGFHKKTFVSYPNLVPFPTSPNDMILIDYILPNLGFKIAQVNSFVYHFQHKSLDKD